MNRREMTLSGRLFQTKRTWFWILFAALCWYGLFFLPFRFPPAQPSISQSWVAGFDNRVSVGTALLASVFVTAFRWFGSRKALTTGFFADGNVSSKIPSIAVIIVSIVYVISFGILALGCLHSPRYLSVDIRYLLDAATKVSVWKMRAYHDFEFAYGPLILYAPVGLHFLVGRFGVSLEICYFLTTILAMIVGLLLLAWILNQLVPDRIVKTCLFVGIGVSSINVFLGANGTLVRFLSAFCLILTIRNVAGWAREQGAWRFPFLMLAYLSICSWVEFMVSPEIGLAFACSAGCWALVSGFTESRRVWSSIIAPVIGFCAAMPVYGGNLIDTVRLYSGGSMNWVLVPYLVAVLYLVTIVAIIPFGMGAALRSRNPDRAVLLSLYCCVLALVPAALSRCDFHHVMFNGIGAFILASAYLTVFSRKLQLSWAALIVISFSIYQGNLFRMMKHPLTRTLYATTNILSPSARNQVHEIAKKIPKLNQAIENESIDSYSSIYKLPGELDFIHQAA